MCRPGAAPVGGQHRKMRVSKRKAERAWRDVSSTGNASGKISADLDAEIKQNVLLDLILAEKSPKPPAVAGGPAGQVRTACGSGRAVILRDSLKLRQLFALSVEHVINSLSQAALI